MSGTTNFLLLHTRLHVSTLFVGHLQVFIQLGLQMLYMLGSHHVYINKILKITEASQLKSDRDVLSGWR